MMNRFGKNDKRIRVKPGERFVFELPALATSGYTWQLVDSSDVVSLVEERIRPAGPGVGASSLQEFEFEATRPAKGKLILEYKQPWEMAVNDRLEVEILVESAGS